MKKSACLSVPTSTRTKSQKRQFSTMIGYSGRLDVTIRYDDECGNGHNTFTITADHYVDDDLVSCGCMNDVIVNHYPEFAKLIKWHLTSSDGPMHYLANTMYHASDKDHSGKRKGEVTRSEHFLQFDWVPVLYKVSKEFAEWLMETHTLEIVEVEHKPDHAYNFKPKYTFEGYIANAKWHQCPFDTLVEAEQLKAAFEECVVSHVTLATAWSEGKAPDLEAARRSAVWPDATLEQLQDKATLESRLPGLLTEFKAMIETLGMEY